MKGLIFSTVLFFLTGLLSAQPHVSIIPHPQIVDFQNGVFLLKSGTGIYVERGFEVEAAWFKQWAAQYSGIRLTDEKKSSISKNIIRLVSDKQLGHEAYTLAISDKSVEIRASGRSGIFYGLQSLAQVIHGAWDIGLPALVISDQPVYRWRGMHLDVCRHFFTVEEVKKYLDYLALYKMNVFHWHLTEDQGWRIAIDRYPKLTETGAWRSGSMVGPYSDQRYDTIRYGGYYTKEDIREVVAYASARHITIVPEIEMPGHALAALAAYPQFSCTGGPFEVGKSWGVYDDVYCAGNDSTFVFLQQILDEVVELFPGEYIHIGGDECPKTRWKECGKCRQRIEEEGLQDEHGLQSWFIQRIEKHLNAKGKKIIGWDEILEGGLAPNAAVMSWRGTEGGITAAQQHHPVVMTPGKPCYFDHYQHEPVESEPLAIGGVNTLRMVYDYNPVPSDLADDEREFILGAQGNVWTEYMPDFAHVEYMALPRMAALAEAVWTDPKLKDYEGFILRLHAHVKILDAMGSNYARHLDQ